MKERKQGTNSERKTQCENERMHGRNNARYLGR